MIATTHAGSLPRGDVLTPLLLARDNGEAYDPKAFDTIVQAAVEEANAKQIAAGVTVVSDGELGKVGYSTYMIERIEGFGGHIDRKPAADLVGKDRVIASTDCGFGTFAGYGKIDPEITWKKLRALGEGADIAEKRL